MKQELIVETVGSLLFRLMKLFFNYRYNVSHK